MKHKSWHKEAIELRGKGYSSRKIGKMIGKGKSTINDFFAKVDAENQSKDNHHGPKILTFDIETAPVLGHVWSLWNNNLSLDMINEDWYVLSWAAKWMHEDDVMYADQRHSENMECDLPLLCGIWKLLDECDIVITQNGKKFDVKKLNARFIMNGMKPPSRFRHIDTLEIAKRHFGFTSNKLEYMTNNLCEKYKKDKHQKYSGFVLWKECLAGNMEAWEEMEVYNRLDVLSLEELYMKLAPWASNLPNFNVYYHDEHDVKCVCGASNTYVRNGYWYTNLSVFEKYRCTQCGHEMRGRKNLLSKDKRDTLLMNVI